MLHTKVVITYPVAARFIWIAVDFIAAYNLTLLVIVAVLLFYALLTNFPRLAASMLMRP